MEQLGCRVDKTRRAFAGYELRVIDDVFQKLQIGRHPPNTKFAQGAIHAGGRLHRGRRPGGDFHQQGIVIRRNHRTRIGRAAIQTNAKAGSAAIGGEPAVIGREIVFRIFCRHTALQGMAIQPNFRLAWYMQALRIGVADFQSFGNPYLRLDNIDACHLLGDCMFDLNAWIDFDEIERICVGIHQEFNGTRMGVVDRTPQP